MGAQSVVMNEEGKSGVWLILRQGQRYVLPHDATLEPLVMAKKRWLGNTVSIVAKIARRTRAKLLVDRLGR